SLPAPRAAPRASGCELRRDGIRQLVQRDALLADDDRAVAENVDDDARLLRLALALAGLDGQVHLGARQARELRRCHEEDDEQKHHVDHGRDLDRQHAHGMTPAARPHVPAPARGPGADAGGAAAADGWTPGLPVPEAPPLPAAPPLPDAPGAAAPAAAA